MTDNRQAILQAGTCIGGYRIENEVGRGAMAVVYRAIQLNLDRPVALKILTEELARNEEFVGRFFNEARAAAALSHANIIQAYDAGVTDTGIYYFAMEFVEGETLLKRIQRDGALPVAEGVTICLHIAEALNYGWHRQQLTHGDIKPENIMLNSQGEAKLADFGLAKVAGHDFEGSDVMLTPLYAAPEAIQGKLQKGDCRADIYAFGATMYHILAGSPPFPGTKAQEVLQRHLNEPLMPLNQRRPGVPLYVSDFVTGLLAKDPDQRFQSWDVVAKKLSAIKRRLSERRLILRPPEMRSQSALSADNAHSAGTGRDADSRKGHGTGWLVTVFIVLLLMLVAALGVFMFRERLPGWNAGNSGNVTESASSAGAAETTENKERPSQEGIEFSGAEEQKAVEQEWKTLKEQLSKSPDPVRAVEMIEAFSKLHAGNLPQDFETVQAQCREALKWHKTAEETTSEQDRKWRFDNSSEPPPGEVKKSGDTPSTADRPKGSVIPETTADKEKSGGESPDTNGILDDYALFIGELAQLNYRPGTNLEPLVKNGENWLLSHPGSYEERGMVVFILNTVFPALEASLPKLITSKEELIGQRFPGRKYPNCRIKDISLGDVLLSEEMKHGNMVRSVPWAELDDPRYLLYLAKIVFDKPDTSVEMAAPFLALIIFTDQEKLWESTISRFPQTDTRRQWERLQIDFSRGSAEAEAVRIWHTALNAHAEGDLSTCANALAALEKSQTAVAFRHRERIAELEQEVNTRVPTVQAGKLLRDARRLLADDPAKALFLTSQVTAFYGNTDFPEKTDLGDIRDAALAAYPAPQWVERGAGAPHQYVAPFLTNSFLSPPCGSSLIIHAAQKNPEQVAAVAVRMMPLLEGLAALELGDWGGARQQFEALDSRITARLTPRLKLSMGLAQALLDWRFSTSDPDVATMLKNLEAVFLEEPDDSPTGKTAVVLMQEYLLIVREPVSSPAKNLHWQNALTGENVRLVRRMIFDTLAYLIDRGEAEEPLHFIKQLLSEHEEPISTALEAGEGELLRAVGSHLEKGIRLPASKLALPTTGDESPFRMLSAALLNTSVLGEDGAEWLYKRCEENSAAFGPVGGSGIYDIVLYRASAALSHGEIDKAIAAVEWGMSLPSTAVFPYYPRFCLLQAGLYLLKGSRGGATEAGRRLAACTLASETETALTELLDTNADRNHVRTKVRKQKAARFWYTWLAATERLGERGSSEGPKTMLWFRDTTEVRSEKRLVAALESCISQNSAGTK